jgi:CheY-specific phosphatase CheX
METIIIGEAGDIRGMVLGENIRELALRLVEQIPVGELGQLGYMRVESSSTCNILDLGVGGCRHGV